MDGKRYLRWVDVLVLSFKGKQNPVAVAVKDIRYDDGAVVYELNF